MHASIHGQYIYEIVLYTTYDPSRGIPWYMSRKQNKQRAKNNYPGTALSGLFDLNHKIFLSDDCSSAKFVLTTYDRLVVYILAIIL